MYVIYVIFCELMQQKMEENLLNLKNYTWILSPDLTNIDIENLNSYSCYDDKCLISTFFLDEILDFLEDKNVQNINHMMTDKFQYKIAFFTDEINFNTIINDLINFNAGRFETSSIYLKNGKECMKIWKKGIFYDSELFEKNFLSKPNNDL